MKSKDACDSEGTCDELQVKVNVMVGRQREGGSPVTVGCVFIAPAAVDGTADVNDRGVTTGTFGLTIGRPG